MHHGSFCHLSIAPSLAMLNVVTQAASAPLLPGRHDYRSKGAPWIAHGSAYCDRFWLLIQL